MTDRYLSQYMVRHSAEGADGDPAPQPDTSSAFGRYWSEYAKPFRREFQTMGKPGFRYGEAFRRLGKERPKPLLGLGGLALGGLMGGTEGAPRWLLGLGLGGVGAGLLYQNRDKIGEWAGQTLGKSFMSQMDSHMKANMGTYADLLYKEMLKRGVTSVKDSVSRLNPFGGSGS